MAKFVLERVIFRPDGTVEVRGVTVGRWAKPVRGSHSDWLFRSCDGRDVAEQSRGNLRDHARHAYERLRRRMS